MIIIKKRPLSPKIIVQDDQKTREIKKEDLNKPLEEFSKELTDLDFEAVAGGRALIPKIKNNPPV